LLIGRDDGVYAGSDELVALVDTPVVQQYGNIKHEAVVAGVIKVENTAQCVAVEQGVVVEQVGVNSAPGQGFETSVARRRQAAFDRLLIGLAQVIAEHIAYRDDPVEAARVGADPAKIRTGQVKAGQFGAD